MKNRLYLIDIFRLPVLISIGWFHLYNMNFTQNKPGAIWDGSFSAANFYWMRLFVPGGLVILALSCFLFGYRAFPAKKILKFIGLFILGILLLFVTMGENPFMDTFLEWDIYHFLIVNFLILYLISKSSRAIVVFGILGFVLLCLPISGHFQLSSDLWQNILFGDCRIPERGGWALFPWSGFVWLFYFLGWLFGHCEYSNPLKQRFWPLEFLIWPCLLLAASPHFMAYHQADIAAGFYCHVFHHTPVEFWSYFIVLIFILRLSIWSWLNQFLEQQTVVRWISNLKWNQNLAFCYLLQIFYVSLLTAIVPFDVTDGLHSLPLWVFDICAFTVVPLVELFARGLIKIASRWQSGKN